ncbi:permease-like cell division protein FtsX [Kurthia sibirica]|uniref:Cell division protein FtsX n=1 Tax=Kurthia sibirica TaxID=202750 RepID=A0A2U3AMQ1_9BACL|nr:permease-like cell division protein FtsX [Kurthia sibirica]PWI25823.1 cell division protein FtsX [Kurthia sibirica]GEK33641.1 cell division protein FtsX [Kurthia sibirica]
MNFKTAKRHVKESFTTMSRNRWMSFASISAVTVTLLLVGVFLVIMLNLNKVASDIENDVEIKVLIDLGVNETTELKLQQQIENMPDVESVIYSSKKQELVKVQKDFGKDFELTQQENPLKNILYVKAADPKKTEAVAKSIEKLEGASEVKYGKGKIEKLFSFVDTGRNAGIVLIIALLLMATFLISNTIKITITARKTEIEIMKLVGATNSFVRTPFILEGMWLGVIGAIFPIGIITALYSSIHSALEPKLTGEIAQLLDVMPFILQVDALLLLMGVLIGVIGSFLSVRKFLKV